MKAIIRLYNLAMFPFSLFVNICYIIGYFFKSPKNFCLKIRYMNEMLKSLLRKSDVDDLINAFRYVPDPDMRLLKWIVKKFTKKEYNLTWNFIPFPVVFFLRCGGDCSCYSRIVKYFMHKIKHKTKQVLLYDNIGNFWQKLQTMHIVTVWRYNDENYIYNVSQVMRTSNSVCLQFSTVEMVQIAGKNYKYKNPVCMRWL